MKKSFRVLSLILMMTIMVTGCNSKDESSKDSSKKSKSDSSEVSVEAEASEESSVDTEDEVKSLTDIFLEENKNIKTEDIVATTIMDFNKDGNEEAYIFVKESADSSLETYKGSLWFVTYDGSSLVTDDKDIDWGKVDGVLDFKDKVYFYMDAKYTTAIISHIWEVSEGVPTEAEVSRLGGIVSQDGNDFSIEVGTYDAYESHYDDQVSMMGHTWKPYYFYYDKATQSIKEYAAASVDVDDLNNIFGENILDKIEGYSGEIYEVMYRNNGILNINLSRPDDEGVNYSNINYDCKTHRFVGAYGNDSGKFEDSDFGGIYKKCIRPAIAEFPNPLDAPFAHVTDADKLIKMGLSVMWANDYKEYVEDYDVIDMKNGDPASSIIFVADDVIKDFKILKLEVTDVDEDGHISFEISDVDDYGEIKKEMPLVVNITMAGDMPGYGFSLTDKEGQTRNYYVTESGKDGSLYVGEIGKSNVVKTEAKAASKVSNIRLVSAQPVNSDNIEVKISYAIDGGTVEDSFKAQNYNFWGGEYDDDTYAIIKTCDIDSDGTDEIFVKVYALGNTLADYVGDVYVFKPTKDGLDNILTLDVNCKEGPSKAEGFLDETWFENGYFYVTYSHKDSGENGINIISITFETSLENGKWNYKEVKNKKAKSADDIF